MISDNFDKKELTKIRGILKIQVIAYEDKSSCLLSYENATNFDDNQLNIQKLKDVIDKNLIWEKVDETVSPMIEIYFLIGEIQIKRMGFDGKKGLHELVNQ
ncbi:hypothetical protein C1T31_11460 [Hanstruepera neustonica]|uniref:Uncharacterized protein n=1 Tax=Hanstruepera neustonica TaxID=1445657 RepID=A0A2K1DWI7_9FLAO|nr:hypothetical protein [Hanstruepera neustonica]PNQ72406.1 hypothetical protein C1T31_11460 [Hanstruepera neustonica]